MEISMQVGYNNNKLTIELHTGGFQGQLTTFLGPSPAEKNQMLQVQIPNSISNYTNVKHSFQGNL